MEDEFSSLFLNQEKLNEYVSSIAQVLATKELQNDDQIKISTLRFLRYLVHPPSIDYPFAITATDFLDALLTAGKLDYKRISALSEKHLLSFTCAFLELDVDFDIKNVVLNFVIDKLTSEKSSDGSEFLLLLWRKRCSLGLSTKNNEKIAINLPVCVEETVINMCQDVLAFEEVTSSILRNIFEEKQVSSLSDLCSRSQPVFKLATTILHELFILSKAHSSVLLVISEFIRTIMQRNKAGVIELFLPEHRYLALMMIIDPDLYPEGNTDLNFRKTTVICEIQKKILEDKETIAILLSYFPRWLYVPIKLYEHVHGSIVNDKTCWFYLLDLL